MSLRHARFLIAACLVLTTTGQAFAGLCGLAGKILRNHSLRACAPASDCEYECHTVMRTMTRTVYETVNETCYKTVYDVTYENRVIPGVERIPEVHYEERPYTYQRPLIEYQTKQVPYTFSYPVYENITRDVHYVTHVPTYETRTTHVPYTTYHPVTETHTRLEHYTVPRTVHYTETIPVHGGRWEKRIEECPGPVIEKCVQEPGCWKWDPCCCRCIYVPGPCKRVQVQCPPIKTCRRVWVPTVDHRTVERTKVVYEARSRQVPYTTTRMVPQAHTREVTFTVTRMMPVTQSRTVSYTLTKMKTEKRVRTVVYPVQRSVPETGTQRVAVTTYREVPTSSTITIPRSIPRTVAYMVTKCVPRVETYQVPVRVCVPIPKCTCEVSCGCDTACTCDSVPAAPGDVLPAAPSVPSVPDYELPPVPEKQSAPSSPSDVPDVEQTAVKLASLDERAEELPEASLLFTRGLGQFRTGDYGAAMTSFQAAWDTSDATPKYAYFLALAQRRAGQEALAATTLARAVELEGRHGFDEWGRSMQRIQGADRLWLEAARSDAGL